MCYWESSFLQRSVLHDHDYNITCVRGGRIAEQLDNLTRTCPEIGDLLVDYSLAKEKADLYESLDEKGQIFSLNAIKNTNLFQYYTGLPSYDVFSALYNDLEPEAKDMQYVSQAGKPHHSSMFKSKPGKQRVLSLEEEFFATLVRLRLGLPSRDIARRFGIAESTFSVIFNTWVILLSQQLELFVACHLVKNSVKSKQNLLILSVMYVLFWTAPRCLAKPLVLWMHISKYILTTSTIVLSSF